jgi:hypothetical protein
MVARERLRNHPDNDSGVAHALHNARSSAGAGDRPHGRFGTEPSRRSPPKRVAHAGGRVSSKLGHDMRVRAEGRRDL